MYNSAIGDPNYFEIKALKKKQNILLKKVSKLTKDADSNKIKAYNKKEADTIYLNQQLLILKHLGVLSFINDKFSTDKSRNELLSILLNGKSIVNISKAMREISNDKSKLLVTKTNYEFLFKTFEKVGLVKEKEEVNAILKNISLKKKRLPF